LGAEDVAVGAQERVHRDHLRDRDVVGGIAGHDPAVAAVHLLAVGAFGGGGADGARLTGAVGHAGQGRRGGEKRERQDGGEGVLEHAVYDPGPGAEVGRLRCSPHELP
jgi:hypothetical protein